jgi:hypothetical protein
MRDWRDTVRGAADLALAGVLVTLAALPVLTAGAALAAGSAAVHHLVTHGSWPGVRACWAVFRRSLVPGAVATAAATTVAVLLVLDLAALRAGAVPGGPGVLVVTALVAAALTGLAALTVAELGTRGWWAALRAAVSTAGRRPGALAAAAGVVGLAGLLALLVHPVLVATLPGYALFALHVLHARRTRPDSVGGQHVMIDAAEGVRV